MYGKLGYESYRATQVGVDALEKLVENISNAHSLGYKKNQTSFVETLNGEITKHTSKNFSQGPLRRTGDSLDLGIEGPGFFEVELPTGQRAYTRVGHLRLNSEGEIVTEEGYRLIPQIEPAYNPKLNGQEQTNNELGMSMNIATPRLSISPDHKLEILEDGTVNTIDPGTNERTKIGKVNIVIFNNPQGLESIGKSYYLKNNSSGPPQEIELNTNSATRIKQGFLEFGNVEVASEFMNLIQVRNLLTANFKVLKVIDKIYENVHYTITRST